MSTSKVCGAIAAAVTALALSAAAYGDTGKSPNGPPGPAGNPNQPAGQPAANAPQGPAGNTSHGQSAASHGKSAASHGKSAASNKGGNSAAASHGKSAASHSRSPSHPAQSHANPTPGTPRKGGREDRPAGKITICHATRSAKNPYVEITISMNGLNGHGPADDPRHHAGSWQDIIPAPAGGCPSTVEQSSTTQLKSGTSTTAARLSLRPEVQTPAAEQVILGARAAGNTAPRSIVLGARASGKAPAAALAARSTGHHGGTLPFTGLQLIVVLLAAAAALLGGVALRRAIAGHRG